VPHSQRVPSRGAKEHVAQIRFDPAVVRKLASEHDLSLDRIRDCVALGAHERMEWKLHPKYGWRLEVQGSDDLGRIKVFLRPVDRDREVWECLTARIPTR
jgi:hypothetical protein